MKLKLALYTTSILLVFKTTLLSAAPLENFYDPTTRPDAAAVSAFQKQKAKENAIQMVFKSQKNQFVVVDGEVSRVGEFVGPFRVVKIGNHELELKAGKSTKRLPYGPDVIQGSKMDER